MALQKEEIQKIVLGGILLVALLYGYFEFLIGPLQKQKVAAAKNTAEVKKQLEEARRRTLEYQRLEAEAPSHVLALKQLSGLIPEGSPLAWYPTRVTEVFRSAGIQQAAIRQSGEMPSGLDGFREMRWGVDIEKISYPQLAAALVKLENEELLTEVTTIQIEVIASDPDRHHVTMTLNNLVK